MVALARRLVLLGILAVIPSLAQGQSLYLTGRPINGAQAPTLGDLCLSGEAGTGGVTSALLSTPLPELAREPSLIPARDIGVIIAPAVGRSIVLVGGPVVYVPATISDMATVNFYDALLEELAHRLPNDRVEVVAANHGRPDLSGIQGDLRFRFPAGADSPRALIANTYLEYRGSSNQQWRFVPIHFRVFVLTPVANQRIDYGKSFTSAEVGYAEIDAAGLRGQPAVLGGGTFQATAAISAGQPIYSDMMKVLYDVRSGEQLRVRFTRGNIAVTVPGIAYGAGSVGDRVPISTLEGSRRFSGTIVTPTEVVVEE